MIRIGSSCANVTAMALGKAVEARYYLDAASGWMDVSKNAIRNKQYLIVTICINHNNSDYTYPNDYDWIVAVNDVCDKLKEWGGTIDNCRVSLVNEPMKYISREAYAHLIGLAYPIIHSNGFLVGAGNEEFFTSQARGFMYQYILDERKSGRINFDILDIHIQGSCNTPELTKEWTDEVLTWMAYWDIPADCTEAFYGDIRTSRGWALLQSQLYHAERIGCPNFCNVFNNLVRSAFPTLDTTRWDKLCFKIDGMLKTNYWAQWKILMDTKGPVPNIKEVFEMYGIEINYVKPGSHNEETRAVQQVMLDEGYDLGSFGADSWYGDITEGAIRKWQEDNGLTIDGIVGKNTWQWIMENIDTGMLRFIQMIARTGRYK